MHDASNPDHHHHTHHTHHLNLTSVDFGAAGHLFPAILQVFVVIFAGYATGRAALISETESNGLNTFISRFALPCMLFRAMATINLSIVDWTMFTSILISKGIVFFTVLFLSLILSSKPRNCGRAGIFAIAATQSNDLALGFPIGRLTVFFYEFQPFFGNDRIIGEFFAERRNFVSNSVTCSTFLCTRSHDRFAEVGCRC